MTIIPASTRTTKITLASATAGPFDIDFRVVAADSLRVWVNDVERFDWTMSPGVISDYSDDAQITFTSALLSGDVVDIAGDFPIGRGSNYLVGDPGLVRKLNLELAHLWAVNQELARDVARAPKLPFGANSQAAFRPRDIITVNAGRSDFVGKSPAEVLASVGGALGNESNVFPTLDDMLNSPGLSYGAVVGTLGYENLFDGGGAFYDIMTLAAYGGTPDGMGDHLTADGLVAKLVRGVDTFAEQWGALGGEVSANLQAAWNAMIAWQAAQTDTSTPVSFSYGQAGTLKYQVNLSGLSSSRAKNVNIDLRGSKLTAVSGGNLTTEIAMLLIRLDSGVQFWGVCDGGKFAACYDCYGVGAAMLFHMTYVHQKGYGIRVRGTANGQATFYQPRGQEYQPEDAEFNTQANFTSRGFSAEDGDFTVISARLPFNNPCIYFGPTAVQVLFFDAHPVGGNPNWDTTGAPFTDMVLVENRATRENHLDMCYFDNGIINDYENTLNISGGHYVNNGGAILTEPKIRQYPQSVGQTNMPDINIRGLGGSASIGMVNTGSFTWAGVLTGQAAYYSDMSGKNTTVTFQKTRYHTYPSNADITGVHIKAQGKFIETYVSGASTATVENDPAGEVTKFSSGVISTSVRGIGYGAGAGAPVVVQATSRTTAVTNNKPTGSVQLFSAAGSATATTFTVNCTSIAINDTVVLSQRTGSDKYLVYCTAVNANSFAITFEDRSGVTVEAPVFSYTIIKGAAT